MVGLCNPFQDPVANDRHRTVVLGWAYVEHTEGPIRIGVDCDAVMNLLREARLGVGQAFRVSPFVHVTARVIAHELMHGFLKFAHTGSEVCHAKLNISELRFEPRLTAAEIAVLRTLARRAEAGMKNRTIRPE